MDKTALVEYIRGLSLDSKLESFLVNHIEVSEMNQELLDRVADLLELRADQLQLEGDMYADVAEKMDEMRASGEVTEEAYKEKMNTIFNEFLTQVQGDLDTVKAEAAGNVTAPTTTPVISTNGDSGTPPEAPIPVETVSATELVEDLVEPVTSESPVPVPEAPWQPTSPMPAAETQVPVASAEPVAPWQVTAPVAPVLEESAPAPVAPAPVSSNNSQGFEMDPTKSGGSY